MHACVRGGAFVWSSAFDHMCRLCGLACGDLNQGRFYSGQAISGRFDASGFLEKEALVVLWGIIGVRQDLFYGMGIQFSTLSRVKW